MGGRAFNLARRTSPTHPIFAVIIVVANTIVVGTEKLEKDG
jgi:hypothetical protein